MSDITIQDVMDSSATIRIQCVTCGRCAVHAGPRLVAKLGPRDMQLRTLQRRLRCRSCASRAEIVMLLPDIDIQTAKDSAIYKKRTSPIGSITAPTLDP